MPVLKNITYALNLTIQKFESDFSDHSARSRESVRWCRSVSKSRRRRACHCRRIREALKRSASPRQKKTKRSRCKTFSKKRKKQPALCVCVRGSSSQDLGRKRPSACPILSKYDECCCTQKRVR